VEDAILEVEDLHVTYHVYGKEPVKALRGLDFEIKPGDILGLVGESGSGKTTLARSIMGLVPAPGRIERGRILFDGEDLTAKSREAMQSIRGRDLTMVVPNPRAELNPLVPVGRQVANVARVHLGLSKAQANRAALEMLQAVKISDPERRFHTYPHELSGGMAQRVVIAMALVCSPKFIISDDATSGLDVTVQAQVLELLNRLVSEKRTAMLYITRDLGVTAHFCNRLAIVYDGQIVETANTAELIEYPMHPYTLMLMAAFSQNPRLRSMWTKAGSRIASEAGRQGCPFAPRCVRAEPRCYQDSVALRELRPGHLVRCHIPVTR